MATDSKAGEKAMPKTEIYKKLAEKTGLEPKQVASIFEALEGLAKEVLAKKNGPGEFLIPGLVKLKLKKTAATKGGMKSVAGRMVEVKPKPASVKVKPAVLKGLKELAK
jgi:nucleoid DNA-binding protein